MNGIGLGAAFQSGLNTYMTLSQIKAQKDRDARENKDWEDKQDYQQKQRELHDNTFNPQMSQEDTGAATAKAALGTIPATGLPGAGAMPADTMQQGAGGAMPLQGVVPHPTAPASATPSAPTAPTAPAGSGLSQQGAQAAQNLQDSGAVPQRPGFNKVIQYYADAGTLAMSHGDLAGGAKLIELNDTMKKEGVSVAIQHAMSAQDPEGVIAAFNHVKGTGTSFDGDIDPNSITRVPVIGADGKPTKATTWQFSMTHPDGGTETINVGDAANSLMTVQQHAELAIRQADQADKHLSATADVNYKNQEAGLAAARAGLMGSKPTLVGNADDGRAVYSNPKGQQYTIDALGNPTPYSGPVNNRNTALNTAAEAKVDPKDAWKPLAGSDPTNPTMTNGLGDMSTPVPAKPAVGHWFKPDEPATPAYRQVLRADGSTENAPAGGLAGPVAAPAAPQKSAKFVEGKVYVDASGKKAVFRNGKFVEVK